MHGTKPNIEHIESAIESAIEWNEQSDAPDSCVPHLCAPGPARPFLSLVTPVLDDLGFALVRVRLMGGDGRPVLQVMAERDDGNLTIADCETISHALSPVLDVADSVSKTYGEAYVLEVSSAGSTRPLTRAIDFQRWAGHEAKLEVIDAIDGQRRFRGIIEGFSDGEARLEVRQKPEMRQRNDTQVLGFKLAMLAEAQLVDDAAMLKRILKSGKNNAKN